MHLSEESFFHIFRIKICASVEANGRHHALMLSGLVWGPLKRQVRWDIIGSLEFEFQTLNYFFLLNGAFNLDSV